MVVNLRHKAEKPKKRSDYYSKLDVSKLLNNIVNINWIAKINWIPRV